MNAAEVAGRYERLAATYDEVAAMLADDEGDLDAVAQVLSGIDATLAALPGPPDIAGLDRASATALAAAARACDARRQLAMTALAAARQRVGAHALGDQRAGRAIQAYRGAEEPGDGRFVDHRR
jgi:hypothetical protein